MKNLICFFWGHRTGAWFRTQAGACSQHSFADGIQCYRCNRLLGIYDEQSKLMLFKKYVAAPEPKHEN